MAFFSRASARIAAIRPATACGSRRRQGSGTYVCWSAAIPVSALMVSLHDPRPAIRPHRAVPAREHPPELLLDQRGDGGALRESVIAGDRLEHLQVLAGRREGADDLAHSLAPRRLELYNTYIATEHHRTPRARRSQGSSGPDGRLGGAALPVGGGRLGRLRGDLGGDGGRCRARRVPGRAGRWEGGVLGPAGLQHAHERVDALRAELPAGHLVHLLDGELERQPDAVGPRRG